MKRQILITKGLKSILILITFSLLITGCNQSNGNVADNIVDKPISLAPDSVDLAAGARLQVVATTNIVADIVSQVGGEQIDLVGLIPTGADPHSFNPTPRDLLALNDAHVIFINGLHLEEALDPVLDNLDGGAVIVAVNDGVETLEIAAEADETDADHEHDGADPHTWFSVRAMTQWTENIAGVLSDLDPANAQSYADNAAAYQKELSALDEELTTLMAEIPVDKRKLVTDHDSLGYLANEYDFKVIGTVIPGLSTMAAPSARDLAALQQQIKMEGVEALFVGNTVNANLAEQIAADTGVQVIPIYTGSLSAGDGPAATYLDFMRYNVGQIVGALDR